MFPLKYLSNIIALESELNGNAVSIPEQVYVIPNYHHIDPKIKISSDVNSISSPLAQMEDNLEHGFKYVLDNENGGFKIK